MSRNNSTSPFPPSSPDYDPSAFGDLLSPSLIVFFSADLEGSTAFKYSVDYKVWHDHIVWFYDTFPPIVRSCTKESGVSPIVWKFIGDEILFYASVPSVDSVVALIKGVIRALTEFSKLVREAGGVGLKGCAWCGNIPFPNAMTFLPISGDSDSQKLVDFLGPHVDAGFRLAKHSSARKLVVSAELAVILAERTSGLHIYFDDKVVLKGVLKDSPYPLLWIDTRSNQLSEEEKLRGSRCDQFDLLTFLKRWLPNEAKGLPFVPNGVEFPLSKEYRDGIKDACDVIEKSVIQRFAPDPVFGNLKSPPDPETNHLPTVKE